MPSNNPRFSDDGSYELGDFWFDGRWNHQGVRPQDQNPTHHLYWFIDALCSKRRACPEVTPARFAERILESRFKDAFPNASSGAWHQRNGHSPNWLEAPGLSSAEQTVIRAGHGFSSDGKAPAIPCSFPLSPHHHPAQVQRVISTILKGLS